MTSDLPFIEVNQISKSFGTLPPVLKNLSFKAEKGDFISLIGPSGCGKSTLLKLLAGLSSITEGSVQIGGMTPQGAREIASFIFQDSTLLAWRTVLENVELGLELQGVPLSRRREKAQALLKTVNLDQAADLYPRQLSGGMKMRVSIARALATQPDLLLMDEPFGALDEFTRDHLNEELLKFREAHQWTAFFVTHSVAEAVFLSSRIFIMASSPGRIAEEILVPFPYPRPPSLRESPEYFAIVSHVSSSLRNLFRV